MRRLAFSWLLIAIAILSAHAQVKGQDYSVDKNGDVVVSKIIEGLSLQRGDIYSAARKYMEDAYKDTKYKIVADSPENGVVGGEGLYLAFYEANFFPFSYFLDAPFLLRVDAKDGRARVSIVLSYYTGKRQNINETVNIHDRVSDYQPVNESSSEHKKLYGKAFGVLFAKCQKTLKEVEDAIRTARVVESDSDW